MPITLDIPATGGVNLLDDPRRIRDDELCYAKNLVPFTKGMLRKRPANKLASRPQRWGSSVGGAGVPLSIIATPLGCTAFAIVAMQSSDRINFAAVSETGAFSDIGSTTTSFSFTSDDIASLPCMVRFGNSIYCFGGYGSGLSGKVFTTDSSTSSGVSAATFTFAGTDNTIYPATACVYRGRMVYANFGPGYENYIVIADPYSPTVIGNNVLSANGRAIAIGSDEGDRIVAVVEISQTSVGSPAESALLILKEHSAYILTGEPNWSTDTDTSREAIFRNLVISRISYDCGCSAPSTIVRTPYGIFWAGWDDVWFFAQGALPVRVGSKIRPALQSTPAVARKLWQATYFGGFYRLAVFAPGTGSNTNLDYTVTTTEITLPDHQWWLDLRNGPPQNHETAAWWGPQVYQYFQMSPGTIATSQTAVVASGTGPFLVDNRPGRTPALYTALSWQQEDYQFLVQYDIEDTRDYSFDQIIVGDNVWGVTAIVGSPVIKHDSVGTEIASELRTKEYDFGYRMQQKGLVSGRADYWTSITDYLRMETLVDGGTSTDTATALVEQSGHLLSVDTVETALTRKFQETSLYPAARTVGKTFQFKIYDTAGYVIGAYQDEIVILYNGTYYAVALTQGYYANLKAVLDHMDTQITAALGISFSHNVTAAGSRSSTITATFGSAVTLCFQTAGGSITEAQLRKTRALFAMLGWDTSVNSASATGQTSSSTVYYKRVTGWEFGGFEVEVDVFNRGPT